DSVVQQLATHPLSSKPAVDDEIFQKNNKTTLGGADGKKQINHSDYLIWASQHKNPAAAWLLQDQAQSPHLVCMVRPKIRFLGKKIHQQLRKQRQILNGRGFNASQFVHANKNYYKTIPSSGSEFPLQSGEKLSHRQISGNGSSLDKLLNEMTQ